MGHAKELITVDVYGDDQNIIPEEMLELVSYMNDVMPKRSGQDLKDVSLSLGDIDSPKDRMILYDLYTSMARKQKR